MEINEIVGAVLDLARAEVKTITSGGPSANRTNTDVLVVPHGQVAMDATPFLEAAERLLPGPRRRRGTFTAGSLESLLVWAERNIDGPIGLVPLPDDFETPPDDAPPVVREKMRALTFFGTGLETVGTKWAAPDLSLRIVGNYSEPDKPAWHDFGGIFRFPVATEWTRWAASNSRTMDQKTFAAFIDDMAADLSAPEVQGKPGEDAYFDETPEIARRYLEAIEGTAAKPIDMIRLSRGLSLLIKRKVNEARNPQTGEGGIEFMAEHVNEGGQRLVVPALFFIRVSIFIDQMPALIPVRLRYEVGDSGTKWTYDLLRPDVFVRDSFLAAIQSVAQRGHDVLMGTPDMPVVPGLVAPLVVDGQGRASRASS